MSGKYKNAALEFEMDGKRYGFNIPAASFEDAERRMRAIRLTGKVSGWPSYSVPVNSLTLPFVAFGMMLFCFVKNLFGRRA